MRIMYGNKFRQRKLSKEPITLVVDPESNRKKIGQFFWGILLYQVSYSQGQCIRMTPEKKNGPIFFGNSFVLGFLFSRPMYTKDTGKNSIFFPVSFLLSGKGQYIFPILTSLLAHSVDLNEYYPLSIWAKMGGRTVKAEIVKTNQQGRNTMNV